MCVNVWLHGDERLDQWIHGPPREVGGCSSMCLLVGWRVLDRRAGSVSRARGKGFAMLVGRTALLLAGLLGLGVIVGCASPTTADEQGLEPAADESAYTQSPSLRGSGASKPVTLD